MDSNSHSGSPRPVPDRIVKPRKESSVNLPIIAVDGDTVLTERGEVFAYSELPKLVVSEPPSIIVAHLMGHLVRDLDEQFEGNDLWQWRATPVEKELYGPNRQYRTTVRDTTFSFFGFKSASKKKGHYHYPLSPHTFCMKTVNELRRGLPEKDATIYKLMEWAKEIRSFLQDNKLALTPSSGGIAAQLLRDKRFFPDARRKVPRHTNKRGREQLPGNFYKLYHAKEEGKSHSAYYLDQTSAHHTAAKDLDFPDPNTLQRRGRYSTLTDRPFARYGSVKYKELIKQHGLFYLAIECPRFMDNDFPLPECKGVGYQRGFFYSNEISYLEETGVRIRHIIACWTSPDIDRGLNRYAGWATGRINEASEAEKPWLKPTLLATYGVLAARPKKLEYGYKQAENAEEKQYPCGSGFITVQAKRMQQIREMNISNVIYRGMIEAQTRLISLQFARELARSGYTILAIYADSIFVESSKPLPLLPFPWRIQDHLTNLKFHNATNFTSSQLCKTPGMPNAIRDTAIYPFKMRRLAKSSRTC